MNDIIFPLLNNTTLCREYSPKIRLGKEDSNIMKKTGDVISVDPQWKSQVTLNSVLYDTIVDLETC